MQESGFRPDARPIDPKTGKPASSAFGIMQLTDDTRADMAKRLGYAVEDLTDPYKNIDGGIERLKQLAEEFPDLKWSQRLMAWHMGPAGYRKVLSGERKLNKKNPNDAATLDFPKLVEQRVLKIKEDRLKAQPTLQAEAGPLGPVDAEASLTPPPSPGETETYTDRYLSNAPDAVRAMAYGAETGLTAAGSLGKSLVETGTAFPRQLGNLASVAGANTSRALTNMLPGPPTPYETLPSLNPMDAANFAAMPYALAGGRAVNTGLGFGLGVLQTAQGDAQAQATKAGLNWDDFGTLTRAAKVAEQVNTDLLAKHLPELALSTGMSWLFGGKPKAPDAAGRRAVFQEEWDAVRQPPLTAAQQRVADANAVGQAAADRKRKDIEEENARALATTLPGFLGKVGADDRVAAENARIAAANATQLDTYAGRVAPIEGRISHAEETLGIPRPASQLTSGEDADFTAAITNRLKGEFKLPATDPGAPFHEALETTYGRKPVTKYKMKLVNEEMDVLAKTANQNNTLKSTLGYLLRPLNDTNNVSPLIDDLLAQSRNIHISADEKIRIVGRLAQVKEELAKAPPPTISDVLTRAKALDAFRREKLFGLNPEDRAYATRILAEATTKMRDPNGWVERLLPTVTSAKLWQQANSLSRGYNNQLRVVTSITKAFGATDRRGGKTIMNRLTRYQKPLTSAFGAEHYQTLYALAKEVEHLQELFPPPPKLRPSVTGESFWPTRPKLKEIPNPFQPALIPERDSSTRERAVATTLTHAINGIIGGIAGAQIANAIGGIAGTDTEGGPLLSTSHSRNIQFTGMALGAMVGSPTIARTVIHMLRSARQGARLGKVTTENILTHGPIAKGLARLLVIQHLEDAYGGPSQPLPVEGLTPQAQYEIAMDSQQDSLLPPAEPISVGTLPALPSRQTGGPIPAPSRSPARAR
jgi:hypothetical protein